jgi:hypothetical protein
MIRRFRLNEKPQGVGELANLTTLRTRNAIYWHAFKVHGQCYHGSNSHWPSRALARTEPAVLTTAKSSEVILAGDKSKRSCIFIDSLEILIVVHIAIYQAYLPKNLDADQNIIASNQYFCSGI